LEYARCSALPITATKDFADHMASTFIAGLERQG